MLGPVRFSHVDGINRPGLQKGIESLRHVDKGEWRLVQVYEKSSGSTSFLRFAKRTGLIVFRDRSFVTFYSNDLGGTPTVPTPGESSKMCVHGLAPLQRWTDDESLCCSTLQIPSLIVAYNLFMNDIARFDQFRSISATLRKEEWATDGQNCR